MSRFLARKLLQPASMSLSRRIMREPQFTAALANRFQSELQRPLVGFDDFFQPGRGFFDDDDDFAFMPVLSRWNRPDGLVLRHSSPGYELQETSDGQYQIAIDVPGVKASDMKVNVQQDGKVLSISGGRKIVTEGMTSETKFEKHFTVGKNVDWEKMTAKLADGSRPRRSLIWSRPCVLFRLLPVRTMTTWK